MRIHTNGKIRIEFGDSFEKHADLEIKQITDSGILFSSHDDEILNRIHKSEFIKFFIDTTNLKKFVDDELQVNDAHPEKFFYTTEHLRYFFIEEKNVIKSLSYKSAYNNEVFLFCRYFHMLESDVPNVFSEFTIKVNHLFKGAA